MFEETIDFETNTFDTFDIFGVFININIIIIAFMCSPCSFEHQNDDCCKLVVVDLVWIC